jgi:hypothetical protein
LYSEYHLGKKEYTEAYHVVNRGMDIRQSPLLFYELGKVNYLWNLYEDAIVNLEKCIRKTSKKNMNITIPWHYQLFVVYSDMNRLRAGKDHYESMQYL